MLRFSKMHGLGNDFMVIDAIHQSFQPDAALIRQWADRSHGVGFDQMLIIEAPQSDQAAFRYRIFNADGEEVSQCGNGARCFARFVYEKGLTDLDVIPVETNAGLLKLHRLDDTRVCVNMGIPQFDPALIPLQTETQQPQYTLTYAGVDIRFNALSIGNPHIVIQVEDIHQAPVDELGPVLEAHQFFPAHTNVGFVQWLDRQQFKLRVFERGAGETRACGSGACAAHVVGCQLGLLHHQACAILLGGELDIEWQGDGQPVMMTGDTALVFEGSIKYQQPI